MRVLLGFAALATAQTAAAEQVRFITCPIYRDTDAGRKSGCWLADDRATGTRYDVTWSPSKPDWNHEVLVEGNVAAKQDESACGGVVLDAVRTSILDTECPRHMLPGEDYKGRKFGLPRRNIAPLSVAREVPQGPYGSKTFSLYFDFDRDFVIYQYDDWLIDNAITWIRAAKPQRIIVTGWAATTQAQVSGRTIAEDPAIARARAEKITTALIRLGVDKSRIVTRWRTAAQPVDDPEADGLREASRRRVDITTEPAA